MRLPIACVMLLLLMPHGLRADPATKPASQPETAPATQPTADAYGDPLPPGAVMRLGTLRLRAHGTFRAAAFAEDNESLLTQQTQPPWLCQWNAADGKLIREVNLVPTGAPNGRVSPNVVAMAAKHRLLTATPTAMQVWDMDTGAKQFERPLAQFAPAIPPSPPLPPPLPISRIVVAPDGKHVALAGDYVWLGLIEADEPIARIGGSRGNTATELEFSADSSRLLSCGLDGAARVWDVKTGKPVCTVVADLMAPFSAAISPDGKVLAIAAGRAVRLYDATTGQPAAKDHLPVRPNGEAAVRFGPTPAASGGPVLAVWNAGGIQLWDLDAAQVFKRLRPTISGIPATGAELVFSPNGKKLAAFERGPICDVFDVETGRLAVDASDQAGLVTAVAVSPDGQTIATGVTGAGVRLWDATTGGLKRRDVGVRPAPPAEFRDSVFGLDPFRRNPFFDRPDLLVPDSTLAMAFSRDGALLWRREPAALSAWDMQTLAGRIAIPDRYEPRTDMALSPDGEYAAVTTVNRDVTIWNLKTGKRDRTLPTRPPDLTEAERRATYWTGKGPRSLAFGPRGVLAVADRRKITLWNLIGPDQTPFRTIEIADGEVLRVAITPDGSRVLGAVRYGVTIWDIKTGDVVKQLEGAGGMLAISPTGDLLLSTVDAPARPRPLAPPAAAPAPVAPPNARLARDQRFPVTVWDLASGTPIARLAGHEQTVNSIAFFPDGRRVVTAPGNGGPALVWDLALAVGQDPDLPTQFPRLLMDQLWQRLDAADATAGYQAAAALAQWPDLAVGLLRERLADVPGERRPARAATALAWAGTPEAHKLLRDLTTDPKADAKLKEALRPALRRFAALPKPAEVQWAGMAPDRGVGSKPTTQPVNLQPRPAFTAADVAKLEGYPELHFVRLFCEAGDARVVPLARKWLEVEAKAESLEYASQRLLGALEVLAAFGVSEDVPELIALHDRDDADVIIRQRVLGAIALIGGDAAKAFLQKHLADATLAEPIRIRIAGALAAAGDAKARDVLLDGLATELAARSRPGRRADYMPFVMIRGLADPAVAERLEKIKAEQSDEGVLRELDHLIAEVRTNALPMEELLKQTASDDSDHPQERYLAIAALGRRGGVETIATLEGLKGWTQPRNFDRFKPTANEVSLDSARRTAIDEIRRRKWREPLPPPNPATRPAAMPATRPATQLAIPHDE